MRVVEAAMAAGPTSHERVGEGFGVDVLAGERLVGHAGEHARHRLGARRVAVKGDDDDGQDGRRADHGDGRGKRDDRADGRVGRERGHAGGQVAGERGTANAGRSQAGSASEPA